jgi:competence protein ComEC
MRWIPFVMVRVAAFFAAGVLVGIYFPWLVPVRGLTVFLTILSLVYLVLWFVLNRLPILRLTSGIIGLTLMTGFGYATVLVHDESRVPTSLCQLPPANQAYRVRIVAPVDTRPTSYRSTGEVEAVKTSQGWIPATGKVMLYWSLAARADTLRYGDRLLVAGSPDRVQGPRNPHEFDYRSFLARKNVFHQHFLQPGKWMVEKESTDRGPRYYATEARRWTLGVIERVVRGDREKAIVAAFVIGVTDGIDDDLRQAYAAGGAMHALAVSGMHVSIMYGALLLILKPLERRKGGPWTVAAISLVLLWMFGFITGLSPSVLRAVTMFSFVAIAKPLKRVSGIYNTLAASAFVLLLFDPWLILSAGFQLSYLAVLGIVQFYRPIYNLWEAPWAWTDWIWQITCVSIAAQVATLPVSLYYFHQFPVYFLLANVFVIPASTLILLGGLLMLLLSPLALVAGWLARILEGMIWLLNEGLFLVGELPGSVIFPIPCSLIQAIALGVLAIAVFNLLRSRRFGWVFVIAFAGSAISFEGWQVRETSSVFTVYQISRHAAMEWRSGGAATVLMDSVLHGDRGKTDYHISPAHLAARIRLRTDRSLPSNGQAALYRFEGKYFLRIGTGGFHLPAPCSVDYLIIGNNAVRSLETLAGSLTFGYLVLDSSNTPGYSKRIVAEAARLGIECYSVPERGAFVLKL